MKSPIRPLHDNLVIDRCESRKITAGGIYIPQEHRGTPDEGTVLAIGPEAKGGIQVGDRVTFKGYLGTEMEEDGNTFLILSEADALVCIQQEA